LIFLIYTLFTLEDPNRINLYISNGFENYIAKIFATTFLKIIRSSKGGTDIDIKEKGLIVALIPECVMSSYNSP